MKTKKNFLLGFFIFSFLLLSLFPVSFVAADDDDEIPHKIPGKNKTDLNIIYETILKLANWFFSFLIAIAVIGIVASGVMFVFAGGDPSKIATAKNMVIYSLIGVLVASLGWVLVNWIKGLVVD